MPGAKQLQSGGSITSVILDRDGVLNVNRASHIGSWEQWQWIPGALDACQRLSEAGVRFAVATNQACVGRGLLAEEELKSIHGRMLSEMRANGAEPTGVFYCPHTPEMTCLCRKPMPGMLLRAARGFGVESGEEIVMVGDHETDLIAAQRAGFSSIHVRSGRMSDTRAIPNCLGSVGNLSDAVNEILSMRHGLEFSPSTGNAHNPGTE